MRTREASEIVFKQIRNNFFVSWQVQPYEKIYRVTITAGQGKWCEIVFKQIRNNFFLS